MTSSQHATTLLFGILLCHHVNWWSNANDTLPLETSSLSNLRCFNSETTDSPKRKSLILSASILQSGDIQPHPGPTSDSPGERLRCESTVKDASKKTRQCKYPCVSCGKGVTARSKAVSCDDCDEWTHIRCAKISDSVYQSLIENDETLNFKCDICCFASLPFHLSPSEIDSVNETDTNAPGNERRDYSKCIGTKGLTFIHVNVRSLVSKAAEIRRLVYDTKAAVLAVSESWLDDTIGDNEIGVDGYSVLRRDRNRHGGGVLVYVKDGLAFNRRPDLEVEGCETLWVELFLPKTKGILVNCCYRPPDDQMFLSKFESTLKLVEPLSSECYILGDMNINVKDERSKFCKDYTNMLHLFHFRQMITEATRITANSSTILDHIVSNSREKIVDSGVLDSSFSDHLPVYCTRKIGKNEVFSPVIKRVRCFKKYSKETYLRELRGTDWNDVYMAVNVDVALDSFNRLIHGVMDKVAPMRDVRVKQRTEPWMTPDILAGIKQRDKLFKKCKGSERREDLFRQYCSVRNRVQRDIKLAKKFYFSRQIEQNKGEPRKLWDQLKSLGYSSKSASSSETILEINGEKCFDKRTVADCFNSFFTRIASKLVDQLPRPKRRFTPDSASFQQFYRNKGVRPDSFRLSPVGRKFIFSQLAGLKVNKSTGLDGISPRFLKDGADCLTGPVWHIINFSLMSEAVPSGFKDARVSPLFKKGSRLDPSNYRPVSILNVLSKILERAVHGQLVKYLEGGKLLSDAQSGFRGGYSTDTCILGLTEYIRGEISKGRLVGMVLLDLQKAFDCVDHDLLLAKLKGMGFGCTDWFRSYLTGRRQCSVVGGVSSDFLEVACGVPQGSILGPTLFLCYINDMAASLGCKLSLYADDSTLIASGGTGAELASSLSRELGHCRDWMTDNRLSLHLGKTECMVFGSKRRLKSVTDFSISCGDATIERVEKVKYLGYLLDQCLNGNDQTTVCIKRIAARLAFLHRNATVLDSFTRKTLCNALIQPHIDYCISSWYTGTLKKYKLRLDALQRKMVRFINFHDYRTHIDSCDLRKMGWLSVPDRARFFKLLHVFRIHLGVAPSYLREGFVRLNSVHNHATRGSLSDFHVPRVGVSDVMQKSFFVTGIKEWNNLPTALKKCSSEDVFKKRLREHLLSFY